MIKNNIIKGLSIEDARNALRRFAEINTKRSGCLDIEDFSKMMNMAPSSFIAHLFSIVDADQDGIITFREFITNIAFLCKGQDRQAVFERAFRLFTPRRPTSVDKRESIQSFSRQDFYGAVRTLFPEITPSELDTLFSRIHRTDTEIVTKEEFLGHCEQNPEHVSIIVACAHYMQHFKDIHTGAKFQEPKVFEFEGHSLEQEKAIEQ